MAASINRLDQDRERIRSILNEHSNCSAIAVIWKDPYPIYGVNKKFLDTLGYDSEPEFVKASNGCFTGCVFNADVESTIERIDNDLDQRSCYSVTHRLLKRDGDYIWVNAMGKLIQLSDHRCVIVGVFSSDSVLSDNQTRELEAARAEAVRANAAKTEFLARMSHDMRTPLNGIIGMTELALRETDLVALRDYLSQISVSGKYLLGLISDVLDMARIESGNIELKSDIVTLDEFLSDIRSVIMPLCRAKNIRFDLDVDPSPVAILADKVRLEQIVINLLSNAAKYTPEGGIVKLTVTKYNVRLNNQTGVRFVVTDTGVGMSSDYLKKAFTAFSREEIGTRAETQGSGLGLSIVNAIVKTMRGTIKIESAPGKGTRVVVHFILPLASGEALSEAVESSFGDIAGKRVLLAEDKSTNAMVVRGLLAKKSVAVERAENGSEALQMFMENEAGYYDAILMDVRMPVMDGLEATRAIRQLTRLDAQKIPIIAVTANAFEEDVQECMKAGMNDHIFKPIEPQKLFAAIALACH